MIVELLLGIDKVLVAVVKQGLFALFKVGPLTGKLGLLLCQLCFAGSQNGFAPGKLCLALGRGEVFCAILHLLMVVAFMIAHKHE